MSFKINVQVGKDEWTDNALRFATRSEAEEYGKVLYGNWLAIRNYKVEECADPINATYSGNALK